jgi:hypothetical protein
MTRNTDVFGKSGHDANERGPGADRDPETRISAGASWIRGCTILSLLIAMVACQPGQADEGSTPPEGAITTGAPTTAVSDAGEPNSTPISDLRPETGWYRLRYSSDVAPLIVHCMNDLGWEATYDSRLGGLLPEVPERSERGRGDPSLSQGMEREAAISLCVASSHTHRGIYID